MRAEKPNKLKEMLHQLLYKKDVVHIEYDDMLNSFKLNVKQNMGEDKTIELIKLNTNSFLLYGFMPKGTSYTLNDHPDADEILTIITGKLRNVNFKMTKSSMGQFKWKAGTPHDLLAIEDTYFYALLTKI